MMLYFVVEKEQCVRSKDDQGKPFGRMGHKAIGPDGISGVASCRRIEQL